MKTLSPALKAHLASEVATICTCWKATLKNGTVYGFTNHIQDLIFESVSYQSASGYTPSAVQTSAALDVDNLNIVAILDSPSITEGDLKAGLWDFATIEVFRVNYLDLSQGADKLRKGTLGEVRVGRSAFEAELRGLMQSLQQTIGELYSVTCRAIFGDDKCKADAEAYTVMGTITTSTDSAHFYDSSRTEANNYFSNGLITFTSGLNIGLSMEVKQYLQTGGEIILCQPMPYAVAVSDTYEMIAGCDKLISTCINKFSNVVNFRGEPYIPGIDALVNS